MPWYEKLDVVDAGLVAVIFGSASGLSGQAVGLNVPSGQQAENDQFGEYLAAGDFNRDGRTELVVGSQGEAFLLHVLLHRPTHGGGGPGW